MGRQNYEGFTKDGNWYKGNLHSHTTNSDGCLKPVEAVKLFREHGYHFLCLSEHDCYTDLRDQFNSEDFIILPGVEASANLYVQEGSNERLKVHHIHGILGTEEMQKNAVKPLYQHKQILNVPKYYGSWDGAKAAQALSDELRAHGCVTTYNHPIWSRVRAEEFIYLEGAFALEIFNYNTVNESGTGYDVTHWDTMLRMGKKIFGFASDDNHNEGLFDDACGGYIVVKAQKLTHDAIIQAMLDGNYYSSAGPEIQEWGIKDGVAYVTCSEVNRVNFVCGNYINAGMTVMCDDIDETMTGAEYKLKGNESYLRIECVDKHGRTAWTNAVFLEE